MSAAASPFPFHEHTNPPDPRSLLLAHTEPVLSSGGSWTELEHQGQRKSPTETLQSSRKISSPLPRVLFCSQLGPSEDLLPVGVTGWTPLLALGVTQGFAELLLFARGTSRAIQRPLEAMGAWEGPGGPCVWGRISRWGKCVHTCVQVPGAAPHPVPPVWALVPGRVELLAGSEPQEWPGQAWPQPGLGSLLLPSVRGSGQSSSMGCRAHFGFSSTFSLL